MPLETKKQKSVNLVSNKIDTAALGSCELPRACAGEVSAYTTGFPAPQILYTICRLSATCIFSPLCVFLGHCVGHILKCLHSVFLVLLCAAAAWGPLRPPLPRGEQSVSISLAEREAVGECSPRRRGERAIHTQSIRRGE